MVVTIVLLHHDNLFQSKIEAGQEITIGSHKKDNIVVSDLAAGAIVVKWQKNGFSVCANKSFHFEKEAVPLDTIIVLDRESKTVLFLGSKTSEEDSSITLPYNCILKIGRNDGNDVTVKLPFVSGEHFVLKNESGNVRVEDCGSTNGLFLNGRRITIARMKSGDILSILSVNIKLHNGTLTFENVGNKVHINHVSDGNEKNISSHFSGQSSRLIYRRSPRTQEKLPDEDIILASAPSKAYKTGKFGGGGVSSIVGSGAMFASGFITSAMSPALLAARAASLVSPITSVAVSSGSGKKQKKKTEQYELLRKEKYGAYIEDQKARIESVAKVQREILTRENPEPKVCLDTLYGLKRNLWERMPSDRDFLDIRIGMGYANLCVNVKAKQDTNTFQIEDDEIRELTDQIIEETKIVDNIPSRVSLKKYNTIGIVGNRNKAINLVRNMIVSLSVTHSFEDVRIVGIFNQEEMDIWSSLKWLPHIWDENRQIRMLAFEKTDIHNLCEFLDEILESRKNDLKNNSSQSEAYAKPYYIFILGSKDVVEKEQIMHNLLLNNQELGVTTLFMFDDLYLLPNECKYIIDLDNGPCAFDRTEANNRFFFTLDCKIDDVKFDGFARRMSAIELDGLSVKYSLPDSVTFLQGFGVHTVDELDVWSRWNASIPYKSLAAPIGVLAGEKLFCLDIHEKAHGPHGLVAGTTGSGKSELLQTWLLSMALTFHPYDVSFVLIDYKGGGMANLLEPLPHVVGKITNIGSNISRSLISLQSEIKRRQEIFDRYNVNHIDKYQKLFKTGQVSEPLPHLIIVADEFAELKKEEPEFMSGLISASRVGRSLGIHLVLATQKPGGVVDDQIQSNSRFRLCLKVQDTNDSREMIKRPDAAKITQAGRSFIRVGEDEYFDMFQSFWSGAPYYGANDTVVDDKNDVRIIELNGRRVKTVLETNNAKTNIDELAAVIKHINKVAESNGIEKLNGPWLPELPERLFLENIIENGFNGTEWNSFHKWFTVPIGRFDCPKLQQQGTQFIDFMSEGHYGIYGAPGTGKTTFLKSLVMSLGMTYSPKDVNIYILDCGGWSMSVFANMPHVGGIALDSEEEKFLKFEKLINEEFDLRKRAFLKHSVNSLAAYREAVSDDIPAIVVIVDNIVPVFDLYPDLENFFIALARDGATYGIYLVFTANSTSGVRYKVLQNIRGAIAFELTDKGDYATIVGRLEGMVLPKTLGRAYLKGNPPIEFQAALPSYGDTDRQITLKIQEIVAKMNVTWNGVRPKPIPVMPDIVTFEKISENYSSRFVLPVGIDCENIRIAQVNLSKNYSLVVAGSGNSGKSSLLRELGRMILDHFPDTKLFVFDSQKASLSPNKSLYYKYAVDNDETGVIEMLSELVGFLNERKKGQNQAHSIEGDSFDEQKYISSFEMICIIIDDLKDFVDAVSNENKNTMERICRMAQDLGVIVLCAGRTNDLSKYNEIESLTRAIIGNQNGIVLSGSPSEHQYFKNNLKYSEKDIQAMEDFGYMFVSGKCTKVKYMSKEEA